MSKRIAIVGNVIAFEEKDARERSKAIADKFGRQLANEGFHLVVYSSHPDSLERYVVTGYVSSGRATHGSIQVHYGTKKCHIDFPEAQNHLNVFRWEPDASQDWEISFYKSLYQVDGMLILGGARSTLIAGLIGIAQRTPLVVLRATGGSAETVWAQLESRDALLTHEQCAFLGGPHWDSAAIEKAVGLFNIQAETLKRRAEEKEAAAAMSNPQGRRNSTAAIVLLVVSLLVLVVSVTRIIQEKVVLACFLLLGPLVAGAAGATIRSLADLGGERAASTTRSLYQKATLGLAAGAIASLLAIGPQLLNESHLPEDIKLTQQQKDEVRRDQYTALTPLALITASLVGFAADRFYDKWRDLRSGQSKYPKADNEAPHRAVVPAGRPSVVQSRSGTSTSSDRTPLAFRYLE
jgi:hypothetical protein